jgi:hypothetical protein
VRQGVAGREGEVDDHLLDVDRVGEDARRGGSGAHLEVDVLAEQPPQHPAHLREHGAEVDRPRREELLAREGEELLAEQGGAVRGGEDLLEVASQRVGAVDPEQPQLGVARDRGEDVVEVVCDAAGQPPDGLQFLGLQKAVLEALVLLLQGPPL